MGFVRKMRGFVMLTAAVMLFAASVCACACPTHTAEPTPERTSCHSHADRDVPEKPFGLAADRSCDCGDSVGSPVITPKPEKRASLPGDAPGPSASEFYTGATRFTAVRVADHPPPQLSVYCRLPFANLPSRAPPRR